MHASNEFTFAILERENFLSRLMQVTGLSEDECISAIFSAVGKKEIFLTDLYFRWSVQQRELMQSVTNLESNKSELQHLSLSDADLRFFQTLRTEQIFLSDLFTMISTLERTLHRSLYDHLVQIYGDGKDWWRDGIPREVRAEASSRFELDTYPSDFTEGKPIPFDRYCYTNFINLYDIMKYKENWNALIKIKFIPKKYREQQKRLGQAFSELNSIRNMVMHPVKPYRYRKEMFDKVQIALQDFNIKFNQ